MSTTPTPPASRSKQAAIVGFGPVGQMIASILAPHGWHIHALDPRPRVSFDDAEALNTLEQYLEVDARQPTPSTAEALTSCSLVVLAVPEESALETLEALAPLLPADALLIETLSRKDRLRAHLAAAVPENAMLSINPLFHPGLGPRGNRIAVVEPITHPTVTDVLSCIEDAGARVVFLNAREHDDELVPVQALTHSALLVFAASLPRIVADIDRCLEFAPPPTRLLIALAARVASGSPETYWDIQGAAPGQRPARDILASALARLDDDLAEDSPASFAQSLAEHQSWFDTRLTSLTALAHTALGHTIDTTVQRPAASDDQTPATPSSKENPDVHDDH
ncbi:prephenate dehydrogenase [Micrococcus luteus]|uniref:NAD(P)-binding domain-containing protein n=1 Tax=Micrococcus luteus TaxID=1270 RepID=UPI00191060FF|nr:2-dehydropantoate 2-reductase N-terminal domain-containing protein [Micrococcus luteus]QQE48166.1 prephenate dehydrogenase [Micrococcus luteus]